MKKKRKRRGSKKGNVISLLIIILGISYVIYYGCTSGLYSNTSSNDNIVNIEEEKEKQYELSLVMVGDNLIHEPIYKDAYNSTNNSYDFKPMYKYLKDIVSGYDLAYYNQETILGGSEIGLSTYPCFNSPYEVGDAMIDAGFNLVSLATNHTLDRGETAVINSCNYWKEKDVLTAGSYLSFEDRDEIRIKEKNNITYTMLNYTYGTNGIPVPSGKEYLVNVWPMDNNSYGNAYEEYKEKVKNDIEKVRDKVDLLIVAMHWGVEYTNTPTSYEIDTAKFLASLGVDIIIGTHPHVVQPVTFIDDTLVIYSLGNLISSQDNDYDYNKLVGLLSSVKITKTVNKEESKITLSDVNNELLYTYYNNYRDYKVIPFSNPDIKTLNIDYQRLYDKYSAVIKSIDNTVPVMALAD